MLKHRVAQIQPDGARPAPKPDNQQTSIIVRSNYFILGGIAALRWSPGPHPIPEAGSDLGAILQQAHHHVALVVLTTKEHCQNAAQPQGAGTHPGRAGPGRGGGTAFCGRGGSGQALSAAGTRDAADRGPRRQPCSAQCPRAARSMKDEATGTLWVEKGRLRFRYDTHWLEQSGVMALSQSLPLQIEVFDDQVCRPFFAGLLPEGDLRRRIAQ